MNVNVGTSNSLKVGAMRAVFAAAFTEDEIDVNAINLPSGVPAQPFGKQVATGAINRACAASSVPISVGFLLVIPEDDSDGPLFSTSLSSIHHVPEL